MLFTGWCFEYVVNLLVRCFGFFGCRLCGVFTGISCFVWLLLCSLCLVVLLSLCS